MMRMFSIPLDSDVASGCIVVLVGPTGPIEKNGDDQRHHQEST